MKWLHSHSVGNDSLKGYCSTNWYGTTPLGWCAHCCSFTICVVTKAATRVHLVASLMQPQKLLSLVANNVTHIFICLIVLGIWCCQHFYFLVCHTALSTLLSFSLVYHRLLINRWTVCCEVHLSYQSMWFLASLLELQGVILPKIPPRNV